METLKKLLVYAVSDHGMTVISFWLSLVAIVIGIGGILRAESLFKKLDKELELLVLNLKSNMLKETETVFASYASFSRSLQGVDLNPHELPQDAAFALLTVFRIQQLLHTDYTPEQFAELRKQTRNNVEKTAKSYAQMLTKSGLATMKPGVEFNDLP